MTNSNRRQRGFLGSLALLELGIFEVIFVGIIIGLILLVLNFFNIISLSTLYPDKLGFLPHRPTSETAQTTEMVGGFLLCPTKSDPCNGEQIFANGEFIGMGFVVPEDFGFYASIPGTTFYKSENQEGSANHVNITGTGTAQGYEVVYDYFGEPAASSSATVLQGDLLGRVKNGRLAQGQNGDINLLFKLTGPDGMSKELKSSDFSR